MSYTEPKKKKNVLGLVILICAVIAVNGLGIGAYLILNKDKDHHSKTYGNAPMPNSERLTMEGVALHAGGLPGYPSTHG